MYRDRETKQIGNDDISLYNDEYNLDNDHILGNDHHADDAKHHDDVIKWKHFPRYWPFVRGIRRSSVNSPHKGQWRGALMFSAPE